MVRRIAVFSVAIALCCVLAAVAGPRQERRGPGPLDPSGAFFHPAWASAEDAVMAETRDGPIAAASYLRYLAGKFGDRYVSDMVFDMLLVRECRRLKLARNAPLIAKSLATQRYHGAGRSAADDPEGDMRRKFANEELRRMRVHAIVGAVRAQDPAAVEELFNRRHGVDGEKVRVRQVLVSRTATRRRLGVDATDTAVNVAARSRAESLRARLLAGDAWPDVLAESDDRTTRALLKDPSSRDEAGFLKGYNYRRFGHGFAELVRGLEVGAVSDAFKSDMGYHVVQVVSRKRTRLKDVIGALRTELRARPASPAESEILRKRLFKEYEVQFR